MPEIPMLPFLSNILAIFGAFLLVMFLLVVLYWAVKQWDNWNQLRCLYRRADECRERIENADSKELQGMGRILRRDLALALDVGDGTLGDRLEVLIRAVECRRLGLQVQETASG